jgi:hypothetical protein
MGINWQDVFYFTASLVMIVTLIICIWLVWLFFIISKMTKHLTTTVHKWSNIVDDIRYFKKDIKLKGLRFLLKILDKGD